MGENKNTIYKNLLVDSKAVLKGIDYVEKQKKKISNQQCNLLLQEIGSRANKTQIE